LALDQRRRALINATLPLLLEHGTSLSTRQIAQAAGVAEGTIFRAFDTKQDLINEVILHALDTDETAARLRRVRTDRPLDEVVAEVVGLLQAEIGRTRALTSLLSHPTLTAGGTKCPVDPHTRHLALHSAVAEVLATRSDELSVAPGTAASVLMAMAFATTHSYAGEPALSGPQDIAHIVLHGLARGES